ncbi:MAG: helix-turn-helix transcriptional regulator [Acidaminococcus provencensis]|jgi:DNA-binding Xre family transcriptional regulator|uniref:helix-turn-helix domain-containing protein n=1 Tax=Acidaminococcus provencensis TaxID=2058289 RepID=UPI0023F22A8A|nr:helix-turn-helix transcriptional regulator [Acidaminococcus provencensis]MCH4096026.1 helix-turn-helix transcriptional regulator [Acidaminococcus provencensis]
MVKTVEIDMKKVKEMTLKKLMSFADLAKSANLSLATLFALQAKRRKASERTLYKIAAALDVSPADIIKEETL